MQKQPQRDAYQLQRVTQTTSKRSIKATEWLQKDTKNYRVTQDNHITTTTTTRTATVTRCITTPKRDRRIATNYKLQINDYKHKKRCYSERHKETHWAHTCRQTQREAKRQQRHEQRLQMDAKKQPERYQTVGSKKQLQRDKTDYKQKTKGATMRLQVCMWGPFFSLCYKAALWVSISR